MDFKKLDRIVEDFINKYKFHVEVLPMIVDYSKKVLDEQLLDVSNDWSRKIEINDSINIVYKFLETIDVSLANQFLNILNSYDEYGNPYVNILPRNEYPNGHDEVRDGKVYVYYENTPNDSFCILHEMLHKMNECFIVNENNEKEERFTRIFLGETVSILGEMMLGNYMVQNGFISESDFNIRKNFRLNEARKDARDVIIENELINLKLNGIDISLDSLNSLFNGYDKSLIEYSVLKDEKNDLRRINKILKNNCLSLHKSLGYVIAQVLCDRFLKSDSLIDDFVRLHYSVGDSNSDIIEVFNDIISDNIDIKR